MKRLLIGLLATVSLSAFATGFKKSEKVYYNEFGNHRFGQVKEVLANGSLKLKRLDMSGRAAYVDMNQVSKINKDFKNGSKISYRYEDSRVRNICKEAMVVASFENGLTLIDFPDWRSDGMYSLRFSDTEELKKPCLEQRSNP